MTWKNYQLFVIGTSFELDEIFSCPIWPLQVWNYLDSSSC